MGAQVPVGGCRYKSVSETPFPQEPQRWYEREAEYQQAVEAALERVTYVLTFQAAWWQQASKAFASGERVFQVAA